MVRVSFLAGSTDGGAERSTSPNPEMVAAPVRADRGER
jgi:hypothetical protein